MLSLDSSVLCVLQIHTVVCYFMKGKAVKDTGFL